MQKSTVLFDHLNYNMHEGYCGIFVDDAKDKKPTSALMVNMLVMQSSHHGVPYLYSCRRECT